MPKAAVLIKPCSVAAHRANARAMNYVLVFLGGGLGAALRYALNLGVPRVLGAGFPWATLIINVVGCFVMGIVSAWFAARASIAPEWRLFLTTGILGGFTTFSAFSLDFVQVFERGDAGQAVGYAAASVMLSIMACFAGLALVRGVLV